jgi:DnaJ-class molecular chaperone
MASWKGKAIGAGLGWAFAGPFGAILGAMAGYLEIHSDDDSDKQYNILGINRNATIEDTKKAYRSLSKKYHPDRVSHLGSEFVKLANDKFQTINTAYEKIRQEKGF